MSLHDNLFRLAPDHPSIANELYRIAEPVQTADQHPFAGEGKSVPEPVRVCFAAVCNRIALAPGLFEPACEHPAMPAVSSALIRIISVPFRPIEEFYRPRNPMARITPKCCLKFL